MAQLFGYTLSLLPPSGVNTAIVGQFSGSKQQEVLVSHGSWLELLRMDTTTRKVLSSQEIKLIIDGNSFASRSIRRNTIHNAVSIGRITKR
jgi:hypothetical protein